MLGDSKVRYKKAAGSSALPLQFDLSFLYSKVLSMFMALLLIEATRVLNLRFSKHTPAFSVKIGIC